MKLYLSYGAFIAIGNIVITLVLYLSGFHSDPDKLNTANLIAGLAGLALSITLIVLGVRAKRNLTPPAKAFTYGNALGAGALIAVFAMLAISVFLFIYQSFINPNYLDIVLQAQVAKLQAQGIPAEQIEKIKTFMQITLKPSVQVIFGFIGGLILNLVICLITAAFLRQKASPESELPPAL